MTRPGENANDDAEDAIPDSPDDAWAEIVAHFGDRPDGSVLDAPDGPYADPPLAVDQPGAPDQSGAPDQPGAPFQPATDSEDRFVPPTPPPWHWPTPWRTAAWAGTIAAPAVLLLCTISGVTVPTVVSYALVAWFVGGFLALVITMRDTPRDPWDDGSRV